MELSIKSNLCIIFIPECSIWSISYVEMLTNYERGRDIFRQGLHIMLGLVSYII